MSLDSLLNQPNQRISLPPLREFLSWEQHGTQHRRQHRTPTLPPLSVFLEGLMAPTEGQSPRSTQESSPEQTTPPDLPMFLSAALQKNVGDVRKPDQVEEEEARLRILLHPIRARCCGFGYIGVHIFEIPAFPPHD